MKISFFLHILFSTSLHFSSALYTLSRRTHLYTTLPTSKTRFLASMASCISSRCLVSCSRNRPSPCLTPEYFGVDLSRCSYRCSIGMCDATLRLPLRYRQCIVSLLLRSCQVGHCRKSTVCLGGCLLSWVVSIKSRLLLSSTFSKLEL